VVTTSSTASVRVGYWCAWGWGAASHCCVAQVETWQVPAQARVTAQERVPLRAQASARAIRAQTPVVER